MLSGVVVGTERAVDVGRLRSAGQRPISNVVDVSNYVMLELNQPNHAYDYDDARRPRHPGARRRRRGAADDTRRRQRTLGPSDLLICDADDTPIGLAGIMGGADSEIADGTTTVALEVAWFEPLGIAASAIRTGLRSDASNRFERDVDPYAIDRRDRPLRRVARRDMPRPRRPRRRCRCPGRVVATGGSVVPGQGAARSNRILGTELKRDDVAKLLDPIDFTVSGDDPESLTVALPSWRPDSAEEIDVIEEVGRHYGYGNIPKIVPRSPLHGHLTPVQQRRRQLRVVLVGLGISEVMPSPFLSAEQVAAAGLDGDVLHVTNPLVADEDILRPSLRPGLLRSVAFNESHRRPGVALFEIGHVYPPGPSELPDEYEVLGVVLAGEEAPAAVAVWREIAAVLDVGAQIRPGSGAARTASHTLGDAARRRAHDRRRRGVRPRRARGIRDRRAGGGARARPVDRAPG